MATTTKPTKPTTNLDFSSVFATNGTSTPFTWLLADYLKGWDGIENTPPSRQQFNALQEHSDKKENFLYNQYLEGYVDKFLDYLDTIKAPINSPTFTGDPKASTPSWSDNDDSLATTKFVQHWVEELQNQMDGESSDDGGGGDSPTGGNGWIKFSNGVIMQWGDAFVNANGELATIYWNIKYPKRSLGVWCTHLGSDPVVCNIWGGNLGKESAQLKFKAIYDDTTSRYTVGSWQIIWFSIGM